MERRRNLRITADMLLFAYRRGVFPMAESRDDPNVHWVDPEPRGVLPLERFHLPRSLARTLRRGSYEVSIDRDFAGVVEGCAARPETWINATIERLYDELFRRGYAHSVECRRDGVLAGGLYGVALAGAFFGESMFSRARDASKVALAHLAARLSAGGFRLLDVQFATDHLTRFGAVEISRADYRRRLAAALEADADFYSLPDPASVRASSASSAGASIQSRTMTS